MDKIVITFTGLLSILGIYWFFFGKNAGAQEIQDHLTILVDGGYKPNIIRIPKDKVVKLTFLRKDSSTCLDEVVLADYKIREFLPLNQPVTITLKPPHLQTSDFRCGMNMFHGRIETV